MVRKVHWQGRHVGRNRKQRVTLCTQQAHREECLFNCLPLFIQPQTPYHGKVLPTFRVDHPPSVNLEISSQSCPEIYLKGNSRSCHHKFKHIYRTESSWLQSRCYALIANSLGCMSLSENLKHS